MFIACAGYLDILVPNTLSSSYSGSLYQKPGTQTLSLFVLRCACLRYAVPVRDTLWMSVIRCAACSREGVPIRYTLFLLPLWWLAFRCACCYFKPNFDPNPALYAMLKVDKEICEPTFAWLTKYGTTTRHMNQQRFVFYILSLCNLRNMKIEEGLKHRKEVSTSASLVGHYLMQMTD